MKKQTTQVDNLHNPKQFNNIGKDIVLHLMASFHTPEEFESFEVKEKNEQRIY